MICPKCHDDGFVIHQIKGPYSPDKNYTEDCPLKCDAQKLMRERIDMEEKPKERPVGPMSPDYSTLNLDSVMGPNSAQGDDAAMLIWALRRAAFTAWRDNTKEDNRSVILNAKKFRLVPV